MARLSAVVVFAAVLLMLSAVAVAAEGEGAEAVQVEPVQQDMDWTWRLSPYMWFSGLEGKVGVLKGLPAADLDASFSDLFDVTDIGISLAFERRFNERWGLAGYVQYMELSDSSNEPAPVSGKVKIESLTVIVEPVACYRLVDEGDMWLDLTGGLRVWHLDNELKIKTGGLAGTKADDKETFYDPVIGFRVRKDLNEKWFLTFAGDLGGFDVGSKFTWQAAGGVGYEFTDRIAGHVLYRHLDVEYSEGSFVWDVTMEGLLAGVSFVF